MENDIVARLRGHIAITTRIHYAKDGFAEPVYVHGPSPICQEAANEIERLRAVVEAWKIYSTRAERDIAQLREERDGARAEVCFLRAANTNANEGTTKAMEEYAASRSWFDLFKDEDAKAE